MTCPACSTPAAGAELADIACLAAYGTYVVFGTHPRCKADQRVLWDPKVKASQQAELLGSLFNKTMCRRSARCWCACLGASSWSSWALPCCCTMRTQVHASRTRPARPADHACMNLPSHRSGCCAAAVQCITRCMPFAPALLGQLTRLSIAACGSHTAVLLVQTSARRPGSCALPGCADTCAAASCRAPRPSRRCCLAGSLVLTGSLHCSMSVSHLTGFAAVKLQQRSRTRSLQHTCCH